MSYSMKKYPMDEPESYPLPPAYLTWIEELGGSGKVEGQVRHYPTLAKAKAQVKAYAVRWSGEEFQVSWRVYLWDNGAYKLIYSGKKWDFVDESLLFQKAKRKTKREPADIRDDSVQQAIASILATKNEIDSILTAE